ncbi:pentatricopeptide repeat-containing protein 1, mitochondrial-like isoform X2 [Limulus polyphemus]|uniref:Pentatricopeptide repeat-containing protein 1, mitochondrial-like isoform X2 n=1 Tax=Limulus polyphemus TaxID=6850 RepID=A0ABM1SLK7_LIMPO|nr:pentatricopeptide repeat-containing protein 1, mitochondrial-like isoform X2 [Limulus polyphemus]
MLKKYHIFYQMCVICKRSNTRFISINLLRSSFVLKKENENYALQQNKLQYSTCASDILGRLKPNSDTFGTLDQDLEKNLNSKGKNPSSKVQLKGRKGKPQDVTDSFKISVSDKNSETELTDSDVFGTVADAESVIKYQTESDLHTDEPDDDDVFISYGKKMSPKEYGDKMKELIKERKLKDALQLYNQMIKEDRVKPVKYIYTLLIGACGRVGYTKMAFKLFKHMRDRGMTPSPATLTGLFNACAETPFLNYGLQKAIHLREQIMEKGWQPSNITFHSMIKAFGRCGDLETAFSLADEMTENGHVVTAETFNFLLQACITNKEAGFTHAIQVFRFMKFSTTLPEVHAFNLLLRAVRDCGIGPPDVSKQLLEEWQKESYSLSRKAKDPKPSKEILKISSSKFVQKELVSESSDKTRSITREEEGNKSPAIINPESSICVLEKSETPNLLLSSGNGDNQQVIGLRNVEKPEDRLALIGGLDGFLQLMIASKAKPDIRTFSLLLETLPSTTESEVALLQWIDKLQLSPDTDFFNLLIKKRNYRKDFFGAKEVLSLIRKYGLYPDIVTFGVLALGCKTKNLGLQLLEEMEAAGFRPNVEIFGSLVRNATFIPDFWYLISLMNKMKDLEDRGEKVPLPYTKKYVKEGFRVYNLYYKQWLKNTYVEIPQHPWAQYQQKTP